MSIGKEIKVVGRIINRINTLNRAFCSFRIVFTILFNIINRITKHYPTQLDHFAIEDIIINKLIILSHLSGC
jgi:hypothetical protein